MERTTSNIVKVNNEWTDFKDNLSDLNRENTVKGDIVTTTYTYKDFHQNMNWKFAILEGDKILSDKFEDIWDLKIAFMDEVRKGRNYTTTIRMSRIFWYEDNEFDLHRLEAVICAVRIEVKKNGLVLYKECKGDEIVEMTKEESEEFCDICGVRIDSFGIERHVDWCPKLNEGVSN